LDLVVKYEEGLAKDIFIEVINMKYAVPNIVNISYGRGVGYVFEQEVFDEAVHSISATKIRKELREKGDLDK
jgi:hypothetical protein